MAFTVETILNEEMETVQNIFAEYDSAVKTVTPEEAEEQTVVSKYVTSLATSCYAKSVEEIANTHVGNTLKRKRTLQQIMQESVFIGANRFGHNFIA